jgi:hypothetical protein
MSAISLTISGSIGAQVFVAEALDDLKVAIHAGDHQDLLEDLRRLRQCIELARMHATWHQIVARPFRRRFREHWRLDLEEALLVEVSPHLHRRPMPQREVLLHARAAQIEIAIREPRVFGDRRFVRDRKWRCLGVVQHPDLIGLDLDFSGLHFWIDGVGRTLFNPSEDGDDVLAAQAFRRLDERLVVTDDDLRDAVAIADVDEHERSEVADAVHPAKQNDVASDIGGRQGTAGMSSSKIP